MRSLSSVVALVRWNRLLAFTVFIVVYVRGTSSLQDQTSAWAQWTLGTLATFPGVLFGFFTLGVLRSPDDDA